MNNVPKTKEKPVLDQESFQRLLAAAYLLQLHNDRLLSIRPIQPLGASPAAGAIVQKRTPSVRNRERHPHKMKVSLSRPMLWKTVDALAIAIVFCTMMGLSIHRLSAVPARTSLASGMLEEQSGFQPATPTDKALILSQALVAPNPRQSPIGRANDIVAENIAIRHRAFGVNLLGKSAARLTSGRHAGVFDRVVDYGPDVTMWSRKSERATPNRLGH